VIEDHPMMRRAIVHMLISQMGVEVCGQAGGETNALSLILNEKPDLALVDLMLEEGHGLDLIKRIKETGTQTKVLIYSMHDDSLYAERVVRAGAAGYLSKSSNMLQFQEAINRVLAGELYVSSPVATRLIASLQRKRGDDSNSPNDLTHQFSNRELQVYELIGQGKMNREIAKDLNLSPKTVDVYRLRVKQKLGIESNGELMRQAVEHVLSKKTS